MTKRMIVAIAGAALLAGCNQGAPQPEQTVQQLMANEVQPTAKAYWDSVQFISDAEGMHEIFPRNDADWKSTRDVATKIGEFARLLQTPAYAEGRGEDWIQIAKSLDDVSKLAEQAADARDVEKTFEVGGTMYSVCSACHQVYPPAEAPEAESAPRPGDDEYDAPGEQ